MDTPQFERLLKSAEKDADIIGYIPMKTDNGQLILAEVTGDSEIGHRLGKGNEVVLLKRNDEFTISNTATNLFVVQERPGARELRAQGKSGSKTGFVVMHEVDTDSGVYKALMERDIHPIKLTYNTRAQDTLPKRLKTDELSASILSKNQMKEIIQEARQYDAKMGRYVSRAPFAEHDPKLEKAKDDLVGSFLSFKQTPEYEQAKAFRTAVHELQSQIDADGNQSGKVDTKAEFERQQELIIRGFLKHCESTTGLNDAYKRAINIERQGPVSEGLQTLDDTFSKSAFDLTSPETPPGSGGFDKRSPFHKC